MLTVVDRPGLFSLLLCRILTHLLFGEKDGGVRIMATDTRRLVELLWCILTGASGSVQSTKHRRHKIITSPAHTISQIQGRTCAGRHTHIQGSSIQGRVASFNFVFVKGNMNSARDRQTDQVGSGSGWCSHRPLVWD